MELKHNDKIYVFSYNDPDKNMYSYQLGIIDRVEGDRLWCRWSSEMYINNLPKSQEEFNKYIFEPVYEDDDYSIKWLTETSQMNLLKLE